MTTFVTSLPDSSVHKMFNIKSRFCYNNNNNHNTNNNSSNNDNNRMQRLTGTFHTDATTNILAAYSKTLPNI